MLRRYVLFFLVMLLPFCGWAQFPNHGEITYRRRFKEKLAIKFEADYKWVKKYVKQLPEGIDAQFTLAFDSRKSVYTFEKETTDKSSGGGWVVNYIGNRSVAFKNQVLTNFQKDTQESVKQIYEKAFHVLDTIPRYHWKIEDDMRMIAGYPCRKAVTTICDSVVVVAFYAAQIRVSGGPESFNGLPGMILGVAIPRLYTTWFATNVSIKQPVFKALDIPRKAREVTRRKMSEELKSDLKSSWAGNDVKLIWLMTL